MLGTRGGAALTLGWSCVIPPCGILRTTFLLEGSARGIKNDWIASGGVLEKESLGMTKEKRSGSRHFGLPKMIGEGPVVGGTSHA